jgi:glycosyltransferase involved in cell wall biosynthesis
MPWVEHQFWKQRAVLGIGELVIADSSGVPWVTQEPDWVRVIHAPDAPGISAKRAIALREARGEYITWFDDDDWQAPNKLAISWRLDENVAAYGSRHAYMFSCASGLASLYESGHEPIIFNSGVYRRNSVPQTFDESKITGEDTDWQERWLLSRPTYLTVGEPLHAWLCHDRNITNKSTSRFFDLPNPIPFDEWELDFLRDLKKSRL